MRRANFITVVETSEYLSRAKKLLPEVEQLEIVNFLSQNPEAGDVLEGAGGIRKLRWKRVGQGKSSGFRLVYFFCNYSIPLFLLTMFAKNEKANLSMSEKTQLKKSSQELIKDYEKGVTRHVKSR